MITTIGDNTGDNFPGVDETQIREAAPTTNYGTATNVDVSKWAAGDWTHGLMRFPGLSNIGANKHVSAAVLHVYLVSALGSLNTIALYRLVRNWVETEATWNIAETSVNWGTAGANHTTTDRLATESASAVVNDVVGYKTFAGELLTEDVGRFVSGMYSNFGHVLQRTDSGDFQSRSFTSSEGTDGQRPYLTVTHDPAIGVTQDGYRWRNDDGSETTATWKAAQNVNISLEPLTSVRLRMLVNTTGDVSSGQYHLEYRKVGTIPWKNIDTFN